MPLLPAYQFPVVVSQAARDFMPPGQMFVLPQSHYPDSGCDSTVNLWFMNTVYDHVKVKIGFLYNAT